MQATALTFATLTLISGAPRTNTNPWEKVDDSDGITVWARDVPNSSIREVKAEAEINASSKRVFDVILDVDHYTEFMPYVVEARVVGDAGQRARYVYQRLDPPLIDERDYTLRVEGDGDHKTGLYFLRWTSAEDKGPARRDDTTRITTCDGSWTIEPSGKKMTHATYHLYTDPGGSIPTWVANLANTRSLPDLMTSIRSRSADNSWTRN